MKISKSHLIEVQPSNGPVESSEHDGISNLVSVVRREKIDECRALLEGGTNPNPEEANYDLLLPDDENRKCIQSMCYTPLIVAAELGNKKIVELLYGYGANVNYRYKDSLSALDAAAFNGHFDVCMLLISCGADPEFRDKRIGRTAIELFEHGIARMKLNMTLLQEKKEKLIAHAKAVQREMY
jgi:ankyrin repeat protein